MEITQDKVTINGKVYVLEGTQKQEFIGDVKIVILQRGWVMVGRFEKNGSDCKLHNASVIRSWGTTKGLGELANGPTPSTKLDPCGGVVEFHELTVIATISCNPKYWKL